MKTFKNTMLYAFICAVWALLIWYWVSVFKKAKKQRMNVKDEESKEIQLKWSNEQKDDEE